MSRILFLCRKGDINSAKYTHGITGLFNSASFVAEALSKFHETKVVRVDDANCIDREVFAYKPDIVILEAIWVTKEKLVELTNIPRYKDIRWVVRVHSKPSFLANEGMALNRLIDYSTIPRVEISGNHSEFNDMMGILGIRSVYLPNIYTKPFIKNQPLVSKRHIDIGCFGAVRPMKNHLQQAIAAINFANKVGKDLRFHINATRAEQGGESVLKNLRSVFTHSQHELVEHPWLAHDEFCDLISDMDIGLQVSLSESFNIISADFVYQNIPIVTSSEVEFIFSAFTAKPNSIASISSTLYFAYVTRSLGLHSINKWFLDRHNSNALYVWKNYLTRGEI